MTERFRGKLLDGDRVVLDGITGTIHHGGASPPWWGTFNAPGADTVPLRTHLTLALDDGRKGAVFVTRINPAAAAEPVEFLGAGPLA